MWCPLRHSSSAGHRPNAQLGRRPATPLQLATRSVTRTAEGSQSQQASTGYSSGRGPTVITGQHWVQQRQRAHSHNRPALGIAAAEGPQSQQATGYSSDRGPTVTTGQHWVQQRQRAHSHNRPLGTAAAEGPQSQQASTGYSSGRGPTVTTGQHWVQ